MGKTKVIELNLEQRTALEKGYRKGTSHAFRTRCRMILLKSEKRSSLEVAAVLGCCEIVVNDWLRRYEEEGILSTQNPRHLQTVKTEIASHPQSVKTVIAKLEQDLDLTMHPDTLKRFLKKLVIASAASAKASSQGKWRRKGSRRSGC
jgi:transposase